jgi:hypothetical protein
MDCRLKEAAFSFRISLNPVHPVLILVLSRVWPGCVNFAHSPGMIFYFLKAILGDTSRYLDKGMAAKRRKYAEQRSTSGSACQSTLSASLSAIASAAAEALAKALAKADDRSSQFQRTGAQYG